MSRQSRLLPANGARPVARRATFPVRALRSSSPSLSLSLLLSLLLPLAPVACIPYSVGATAQTVAPGERTTTAMVFVIPDAVDVRDDGAAGPMRALDWETRFGIDDRSDVGVRIPSGSGVVVNYKRRVAGAAHPDSAAVATMFGGGLVNWGEHAHLEATLLASARTRSHVTPYGGLRVMQVAPLSRGAVHDTPTAGGFLGLRIGSAEMGVSPELAVYWDRSALGLRDRSIIIVPTIALHGDLAGASRLVGLR